MSLALGLCALVAPAAAAAPVPAATLAGGGGFPSTTWTAEGGTSEWNDPANWSDGVPDATTDVLVPSTFETGGISPSTAGAGGASCHDLTLDPGGVIHLALGEDLLVTGDLGLFGDVTGGAGSPPGADPTDGELVLDGANAGGHVAFQAGPGVSASRVVLSVPESDSLVLSGGPLHVTGSIVQLEGRFEVQPGVVLTVGGDAIFEGGELVGSGELEVDRDVVFDGTVAVDPPRITCRGDWTADELFAPLSGEVVLDDAFATQVVASPTGLSRFHDLRILGFDVQAENDVRVGGALRVEEETSEGGGAPTPASFAAPDTIDVIGDSVVDGSLSVGTIHVDGTFAGGPNGSLIFTSTATTNTFSASFFFEGHLLTKGNTKVVFDGGGIIATHPTEPLPQVEIDGPGPFVLAPVGPVQKLSMQSLVVRNGQVENTSTLFLGILGDAEFLGGSLVGGGDVDIDGDATFGGTTVDGASVPSLYVAGDWVADEAFAPLGGIVHLDGTGPATIAAATPGATLSFQMLRIVSGTRSIDADAVLDAASLEIEPGAALELVAPGVRVDVPGADASVRGRLSVGAGAELALGGAASVDVELQGELELLGAPDAPARVVGHSGGGYALRVAGRIAASNYVFEAMGPAGIEVDASATIAPKPDDLRGGVFDRPFPADGSLLLTIEQPSPVLLAFVALEDSDGTAEQFDVFNVRNPGTEVVQLIDWSGALGGPDFEDPLTGDLIDWLPAQSMDVGSFQAIPGPASAEVTWSTTNEFDVEVWIVEFGPSDSGPFTELVETPGAGGHAHSATYHVLHEGLQPDEIVHYRLWERHSHGVEELVATTSTKPYEASLPSSVLSVGPSGEFASLQAALDAATAATSVLLVEPGTYAAFRIEDANGSLPPMLHVIGDQGGDVWIDTSAGSIEIDGLAAGKTVELSDLRIGDASTTNPGVRVHDCQGLVVLDQVVVEPSSAPFGLEVVASPQVVVQRSELAGPLGMLVDAGSLVLASRTVADAIAVQGGSAVRSCEMPLQSASVSAGSKLLEYPGAMPDLDAANFQTLGVPFDVAVTVDPGMLYQVGLSTSYELFLLEDAGFWQMALLLDYLETAVLVSDFAATGQESLSLTLPPESPFLGLPLVFQAWRVGTNPASVRFSNVLTVYGVP